MYDYNSLDLTWLNSNPLFGFYGVEIFTGVKAEFEYPCVWTLMLLTNSSLSPVRLGVTLFYPCHNKNKNKNNKKNPHQNLSEGEFDTKDQVLFVFLL